MVLNYQRWTPPCGCSFEQEVNTETNEIRLLFTHSVCANHEDIAKRSKPKSLKTKITREEIINKKNEAWDRNHQKNRDDFENLPHIKKIKNKINSRSLTALTPDEQLLTDFYYQQQRDQLKQLEDFRKSKHLDMLIGLESDYALDAQEVYDHIVAHPEEQNKIIEGSDG